MLSLGGQCFVRTVEVLQLLPFCILEVIGKPGKFLQTGQIFFRTGIKALELVQNVNGTPTASVVLENQVLQFPYDLDITGAPGISEGTLYLSEQVNGVYQELGNYSITFAKVE